MNRLDAWIDRHLLGHIPPKAPPLRMWAIATFEPTP